MKLTLFQTALLGSSAAHVVILLAAPLTTTEPSVDRLAVSVVFSSPPSREPAPAPPPVAGPEPDPAESDPSAVSGAPEPAESDTESTDADEPPAPPLDPSGATPVPTAEADSPPERPASVAAGPPERVATPVDREPLDPTLPAETEGDPGASQERIDALLAATRSAIREQREQRARIDYAFRVREALREVLQRHHPGAAVIDGAASAPGILVAFRVDRDGYLFDLRIKRSPGSPLPAASLQTEIQALSPFPAPPLEVPAPLPFSFRVWFQ
ncbi:MAG: TonB C-terminal domain-containing protein [Planctomycetota bacterium]